MEILDYWIKLVGQIREKTNSLLAYVENHTEKFQLVVKGLLPSRGKSKFSS